MTIRVDTMRRIDHLAGVPLCALLSPFVLLFDWLRNLVGQPSASPKKVLFIELSEMGSAILVDPAMRETIKRGAQIYFLIFKSNQVSLELLKTVPNHQVLTIDASGIVPLILSTMKVLWQIHQLKIDPPISLLEEKKKLIDLDLLKTKLKDTNINVDNLTEKEIIRLSYWCNFSKDKLCKKIEDFFKEKDIIRK